VKRLALAGLLLAAAIAALPVTVSAQTNPNLEIGIKPYGSYDSNDFDSVSVTNFNLFLHIPFLFYPQRGSLTDKAYITYNGKNFSVFQWCNSTQDTCQSRWIWGSLGGHGPIPGLAVVTTNFETGIDNYVKPPGINYWSFVTWDGSIHEMGIKSDSTQEALDGSGLRYNPSGQTGTVDLRSANGDIAGYEDTNGNLFDTLARTSGTPPSTDTTGCVGPLPMTASIATFPGFNAVDLQVKYCLATGTINTGFGASNNDQYGNVDPIQELHTTEQFVQTIIVYNGSSWATSPAWSFTYDAGPSGDTSTHYGDLLTVTLPTGGTISYTWYTASLCTENPGLVPVSRGVSSRTINADDGLGPLTTQFGSTTTDPMGNDTVHVITGLNGSCSLFEIETDYYQGSQTSGTLLKKVTTKYQYQNDPFDLIGDGTPLVTNVFPTQITTIWPNGMESQIQKTYDANLSFNAPDGGYTMSYGKPTEIREYDYGSGAPGSLLKRTDYTYLAFNTATYLTANILDPVASETVYNGSGTQVAQTTYGYDEYALQTTTTPQHTTPYYSVRGNRTSVKKWLNTTGTTLNTFTHYYDTGMPYQVTDPRGNITTYSYSGTYDGAYLTETQFPTTGSGVSHTVSAAYDFNTGKITQFTDQNGQPSNYTYDVLWQPLTGSYPDGGLDTITYHETSFPYSATLTKKLTASLNSVTTSVFDGLGRVSQSQLTSDPSGTDYTDTTYDRDGRKYTVSNPYRTKSDPTYGITSTVYDALGRACVVIPPDGTSVANTSCPAAQPSNDVFTTYSANTTTVTDQQGKSRKSQTDGLGRLTNVWEDPAGLDYETVYTYDALGDLLTVVQGGSHNRTFVYDSLKRLTSSTNPETGTVTYTYDADGNVLTKKDARSITTTYAYDALNRMTGKTYSNSDPAVAYTYDQSACLGLSACYNIGRRTSMTDAAGSESWAYDQMGRELAEQRTTNAITKNTAYTYNLDGSLLKLTYPSGRVITYAIDAAARPISALDTADSINYAQGGTYAPQGALSALTLGAAGSFAGINVSNTYNTRLEPNELKASSSAGTAMDLSYSFVDASSHNNGNVIQITNNKDTTRTQQFTYDSLNRILTAKTTSTTGTNCWGQSFGYDQWANLTSASVSQCTAPMLSVTAGTNNQLTTTGFSYDASGNVLADGTNTYALNAESQIKTAASVNYTYDGDGDRVEKSNGKIYWYGIGSEVLDESDSSGNITDEYIFFGGKRVAHRVVSGNAIYYYAEDFLGSSRVMTTSTGTVCYDADFYPYGGERVVTNTCPQNYKFTGKERDAETNNDDFGARYYSSQFGRWTSPDWSAIPAPVPYANLSNPQTLNLYAMVRDNPETFADLDGHGPLDASSLLNVILRSVPCLGQDGCDQGPVANTSNAKPPKDPGKKGQCQDGWCWDEKTNEWRRQSQSPSLGATFVFVLARVPLPKVWQVVAVVAAAVTVAYVGHRAYLYYSKGREQRQIEEVAREKGVDRWKLGDAVEEAKDQSGRGGGDNLTIDEIRKIADEMVNK
jgi:RHS repeat-associated protein